MNWLINQTMAEKKQCETSKLYLWLISWIMSILQFTIWTLAVDVVLFKRKVIFKQYGCSKKHAISSVMIYRLSDKTGQLTSVHKRQTTCKTVNNGCTQDSHKSYYERTQALNEWNNDIILSTYGYMYNPDHQEILSNFIYRLLDLGPW
jgi:hypothetical protein